MTRRKINAGFKVIYDEKADLLTVYRSNGYLKIVYSKFIEEFKPKKRMAIMRKWSNLH